MQTTSPIQLDCLPDEKCWFLFKHFAFNNGEVSENEKLLEIGRGIVKKCKGSPLVTKVLGGILRYEMDEEKWREVLESDISEIDESGKNFTPLQLSYQKLPLHLKPCFVYLAMFPKGKLIDKDHVVRLWMAQGYINSNSRTKKTLEEIGSEYLNELQGRSLIDFGFFNTCYIHDLIHDLARSISERTNQPVLENNNLWNSSYKINHLYLTEKQELSDFLAFGNNKVFRTYVREYPRNYRADLECPINYEDVSAIFSKITYVRALQLCNCMLPDTLSMLKHLRYLSIKDDEIESLPESLCLLYHLQTLDMNCHNIPVLPENIKSLINLRFLQLRSGKIEQLPESISQLHNLDTLSIEQCSILKKLPTSIEQLTNLCVLKLSKFFICNLPSGIGKLTNLITLSGHFKVMGSDMTQGIGELRDLNRLSGLMYISGLKNVGNIEYSRMANLLSKPNLRHLILNFEEDNDALKSFLLYKYQDPFCYIVISSSTNAKNENDENIQEGVLESLQPHGNLTQLVILNYGGRRVPPWLLDPSLISKVVTLTLHFHTDLTFLPFLLPLWGQLLHLKYLKICGGGDTSRKLCEEPSFNNMWLGEGKAGDKPFPKKLLKNNCPNLWEVTIPQNVDVLKVNACGCQEIKLSSHSELKRISLSRCPKLMMLSAIPLKLKQLDIKDCGFQEINFSSLSKLQKISIFSCRELVSIYYKIGDLPFLESILLSGCPKLLTFSAILEEMKQMNKKNSVFQSEIQNVPDYRGFIPPSLGIVSLFHCPNLRIFSAIPDIELYLLKIIHCGIHEIILPSRCKLLEIHNCLELISVHWRDGDSCSLPLVKFVDCPQLKLLKIPKEVEVLQIKSCSITEISFSLQSKVQSVHIYDCPELYLVHWMNRNVSFLKDLLFEGCPELISLQFLQGDLPLLEKFAIKSCPQFHEVLTIPYQLKELKIIDCRFPEIHLLPQSKLQRLTISECANLTAIKGLEVQFPTGDVSHPMMEMVEIHNCPRMDFGTQGNSYFYQRVQSSNLE